MFLLIFENYIFPLLNVLLTWPVVFLVVILIFRKKIGKFIDEIGELDWSGRKVTRRGNQESLNAVREEGRPFDNHEKWDYKKLFLDLFLQPNTITALQWFYHNPIEHTGLEFSQNFSLMEQTQRHDTDEKNAILQALRENELIDVKSGKYSISDYGKIYLKDRNLI